MLTGIGVQAGLAKSTAGRTLLPVFHYEALKCSTQLLRKRSLKFRFKKKSVNSFVLDLQMIEKIHKATSLDNQKLNAKWETSTLFNVFLSVPR